MALRGTKHSEEEDKEEEEKDTTDNDDYEKENGPLSRRCGVLPKDL